jgi:hypothetical protein
MSPKINRYYDIRAIATRHKIATAIVGGIVATHLATMFGYWDHVFGLRVLNWNFGNGLQLLPLKTAHASYVTTFLVGGGAHYMNGLCFALLFAFAVHPLIPIRNTARGNLAKGLIWGTILGFVSAAFMTPYVFEPQAHLGFFSHRRGFLFVLAIFIWHWIYGATLATIYNPLPDDEVIESQANLTQASTNGGVGDATQASRPSVPVRVGA